MNFLYTNNGRGFFSSLMSSLIFWIIVILIILMIVLSVMRSNKKLGDNLRIREIFHKDDEMDSIRESIINEINYENSHEHINNGVVPSLNKFIDSDLDEETEKNALLLGSPETANVKSFYRISSKKEGIFKLADETQSNVVFKLELKDLTKITHNPSIVSEMKLYNQNRKCIATFTVESKKITIRSISPYFDDIVIDLEDATRLLVFSQISNKLMVDTKQIAAFNIYDKITYFYIMSPIIKELQYL